MITNRDHYVVRRLRLRHFELLVELAGSPTMRGAAQRLNLSQPAISKMLVEIEEAFGARLFERSRQGVRPNAFGIAATHHARLVLGELSRAADELEAMGTGASALLRLGTLSVTAAVPRAIAELHRHMPGAAVQIREGRVHDLLQRLLDGELDCVFGAITPEALAGESLRQIQAEVIVEDRLCVLAATRHPLARRRRLDWAGLAGARWVTPPPETLVRQAWMSAFMNAGADAPVPVVETLSSVTIGAMLRLEPSLLGAVRYEHARDELARGGVRQLPVGPEMPLPPLCLFTRRAGGGPPVVVQAFARALRGREPAR